MHLATVTFGAATNIPEDDVVNTFHFQYAGGGGGADFDNIKDMLADFYLTVPAGRSNSIHNNFSTDAFNGTMTYRVYDLSDPKPRAPKYEEVVTGVSGFTSSPTLPTEVASVLTFQGAQISGTPQARRRNRIYLGPLAESANNNGRPTGVNGDAMAAARDMLQASNASVSWTWSIWSPTASSGTPVVGGWTDDAFDTQRRRGWAPTVRQLWDDSTP